MEEPKIELTAKEFTEAITHGEINSPQHGRVSFIVSMQVDESTVSRVHTLKNIIVVEDIEIENLNLSRPITLDNCELGSLSFWYCNFIKTFTIQSSTITNIDLSSSSFKNLNITKLSSPNFVIYDSSLSGHMRVNDSHIELLHTSALTITESLEVNNSTFTSYIVKIDTPKHSLKFCTINKIHVPSVKEKALFEFIGITFNKIAFAQSSNNGIMRWIDITSNENSEIIIVNSVAGKWDLINCNLLECKMILQSSKITDAFYTNTTFPQHLSAPLEITNKKEIQNILRDGYNQLKTLAQKQNDRKLFLHFQSAELNSYYKTLHWFTKDFATKLQLWALRWSNDFGTKWTWGVAFTLAANAICLAICYWDYWPNFGKESF